MGKKSNIQLLAFLSVCAFIMMIIINTLAVTLPLNGKTTRELSAKYVNMFTPANVTFSIWVIIYLLLFMFMIFTIVKLIKKQLNDVPAILYFWFIVSCILNSLWIIMWHYEYVLLSLIVMIGLLLTLITAYSILHKKESKDIFLKKLFVFLPFSIYLGWISIATIANVSAWLVSIGWNSLGINEIYWTMAIVFIASLLAVFFIRKYGDIFYAIVIDWAFFGIVIKLLNSDFNALIDFRDINNKLVYFIMVLMSIITIFAVIISLQKKIYKYQKL